MKINIKKFIYLINIVSLVATVVLSIVASVKATQIDSIEQKINQLQTENSQLSADVIQKSSLTSALQLAPGMGFTQERTVVYLNGDTTVAQLR